MPISRSIRTVLSLAAAAAVVLPSCVVDIPGMASPAAQPDAGLDADAGESDVQPDTVSTDVADVQSDTADEDGSCGHDCLGGQCDGGKCQPVLLAEAVGNVYALVKDESFIYGTAGVHGSVWRVPVDGCADPASCATQLSTPGAFLQDIVLDGNVLFFTDKDRDRVARVDTSGENECTIADNTSQPMGIAVDENYVYWSANGGNAIMRGSKQCDEPASITTLVTTEDPGFLRLDATGLYWTKVSGGLLSWASLDGTSTDPVWSGNTPGGFMFAPALDDGWVYWRDGRESPTGGTARMVRAPKDRSGTLEVLADDQPSPRYVAVDETHVYWTTTESVRRRLKTGAGNVETLATGLSSPHGIIVDDEAVYFGTFWGEQVFKLAK